MAKFRVERNGGEYVFPSIGLIANDGDIVDLPSDTDIVGLVPVEKSNSKPADNPTVASESVVVEEGA